MATTTPYLMTVETGMTYIFLMIIFASFLMFILYIIYPVKDKDSIVNDI